MQESPRAAEVTELPLSARVQQSERTAARVIEGKALVITIDDNRLHVLNPVGTRVWEMSDGRSLEQMVQAVVRDFEVDEPQASTDVRKFVASGCELVGPRWDLGLDGRKRRHGLGEKFAWALCLETRRAGFPVGAGIRRSRLRFRAR